MRKLSMTFRSIKPPNPFPSKLPPSSKNPGRISTVSRVESISSSKPWCVYLIISTAAPVKTYVGVTNDFSRRLKQHNGELKGGAKASLAGRPWVCACIIHGFSGRSEACEFESKWKNISRKLPRERKNDDTVTQVDDPSRLLLKHRLTALNKVKDSFNCTCLDINWQVNPF